MPRAWWTRVAGAIASIAIGVGLLVAPAAPASAIPTSFECIPGSQGFGYSYGNTTVSLMSGTLYLPSAGVKTKLNIGTGKINWAAVASQLDSAGQSWLYSLKWVEPLIAGYDDPRMFADRARWLKRAQDIVLDFSASFPNTVGEPVWNGWVAGLRTESIACVARDVSSTSPVLSVLVKHAEFEANAANYLGGWNQGLEQDVALLSAGCVMQNQGWVDLANKRAAITLDASINPDGSMNEQAPGYAVWAFSRWMVYATVSRQCGNTGLPQLYDRLRLALQYLNDSIRPDGNLVPIGDTATTPPSYDLKGSGQILNFSPVRGTMLNAPTNASISNYPDGGFLYARTNYGLGAKDQFLSLRFGPTRYAHGHYDHTSVTWWGDGHPVLIDSGFYGYGTTGMSGWMRSPEAHNVLTVPAVPFRSYSSSVMTRSAVTDRSWFYETKDQSISNGVDAGGAYQGLTRIRGVLMVPDAHAMVVLDRLDKSKLRWMYSAKAKATMRWWHLDKGFTTTVTGRSTVTAVSGTSQVTLINVAFPEAPLGVGATKVVKGATAPTQGWMATGLGKLYQAPAVGMASTGNRMLSVIVDSTKGTVVKARLAQSGTGWLLRIDNGANVTNVRISAGGTLSVL